MYTSTLAVLGGLAAAATAETIYGVVVFARHGDRTTKHFGSQVLTPLGAQQVFQVGSDYRARYLAADSPHRIRGISEVEYVPAQVYASAPDQSILLSTATSFLQALYPPLGDIDAAAAATDHLANSTSVASPLSGYQYVTLHGVNDDSPEAIWIKGDDNCPAITAASADFKRSREYTSRLSSTSDFYRSLYPLVPDVYPSAESLSYDHAYDIYDVINVEHIHNASSPAQNVTADQLLQLRTLADSAEFGLNYNASQPARSIHAATFAGAVLSHLNQTVLSAATNPKFTLLAGSYDTFLAFFGLAGLTDVSGDFFGLPAYASSMAFELFTAADTDQINLEDVRVRYLFRNGTEGRLTTFPLFGSGKADLPWEEFVGFMQQRAISSVETWCFKCQSDAGFCARWYGAGTGLDSKGAGGGAGSVAMGSWVTVVVVMAVAIAGNFVWAALWWCRSRRNKGLGGTLVDEEAESVKSYRKESIFRREALE
ncbi:histidine phosphatase superfamily [Chaetomidium leptoderma]|uniref:Histidine phosphatase superfamily n=1 Tax=Chaetomidium leptoderma TaxID=669021 RepID=A0AAN6ZZN9_9PEZI|nr:histidine phosphatase superfamily [Chaetomidium leptoderma]